MATDAAACLRGKGDEARTLSNLERNFGRRLDGGGQLNQNLV